MTDDAETDVQGQVPQDVEVTPDAAADEVAQTAEAPAIPPQYGVGAFSVREVALGGVWFIAFVLSFLPVFGAVSLWGLGLTWLLTIGLPTAAVFLVILRRLSPDGIRRVGSLGIDQFASVAFSVSAAYWLTLLWQQLASAFTGGSAGRGSWLVWVEFILMLAGVVCTVVAPHLPVLGEDFRHREVAPAHPSARRLRPVVARPRVERPAVTAPHQAQPEGADATAQTAVIEPIGTVLPSEWIPAADAVEPAERAEPAGVSQAEQISDTGRVEQQVQEPATPAQQAFWALAPVERDVLDVSGAPIFTVGPTAWALVVEDRGEVFVVRHEDGRIGFLHDVTGVIRG